MTSAYPRTGGWLRRKIALRREPDGAVVAWLEDDFHHIGLTLAHDGERVTQIAVEPVRLPFSMCPFAADNLQTLVGQPLTPRASDIGGLVEMRQQCTHMFDLAGLALAHAARRIDLRRYEVLVEDRPIVEWQEGFRRVLGRGEAWVMRDGAEVLRWSLDRRRIVGPARWAGQSLTQGFRARTEALGLDAAEAATVLRRAIMVASGRTLDPERFANAGERGQRGVCFTFLDENRDRAAVMRGAARDYAHDPDAMLAQEQRRPGSAAIDSDDPDCR